MRDGQEVQDREASEHGLSVLSIFKDDLLKRTQKPYKKPAKAIPAKPKDRSKEADAMKKQRLVRLSPTSASTKLTRRLRTIGSGQACGRFSTSSREEGAETGRREVDRQGRCEGGRFLAEARLVCMIWSALCCNNPLHHSSQFSATSHRSHTSRSDRGGGCFAASVWLCQGGCCVVTQSCHTSC